MYIPPKALHLAGFALGHAAAIAAALDEGELICPFAFLELEGKRVQFVFESDSQVESISSGRNHIKSAPSTWDYWAFAWEGFVNLKGSRVDGLNVEFGFKRQLLPTRFVYPFTKSFHPKRFRLIGSPWYLVAAELQEDSDWENERTKLMIGLGQHEEAIAAWSSWVDTGS